MRDLGPLLRIAARHPWYRGGPGRIDGPIDQWPVLSKADLYERLSAARARPDDRGSIYYSRSGGTTTGVPLFFPTDVRENHAQRRRIARRLADEGVLTRRTVAVNIFPILRMYRAMEIFNEIGERCGATMLPMAALASDEDVLEIGLEFGADTLIGTPSRLIAFARFLQENHRSWRVDTVLFGGEFLQRGKRKLLERTLEVRRFSALYGSAELGIVGWQADVASVPTYHFPRDIVHLEILDPDEQGYGAVVGTNVLRKRFPIIRYDTGDVGRLVDETDDAVTIELRGRKSDSFLIGDNYHSIDDFAEVCREFAEFQVQIQFDESRRKDLLRFCLVPAVLPVTQAKREEVTRRIHAILQGHEIMYGTEVDFVGPETLVRGLDGSKTPAIIDRRGS